MCQAASAMLAISKCGYHHLRCEKACRSVGFIG